MSKEVQDLRQAVKRIDMLPAEEIVIGSIRIPVPTLNGHALSPDDITQSLWQHPNVSTTCAQKESQT